MPAPPTDTLVMDRTADRAAARCGYCSLVPSSLWFHRCLAHKRRCLLRLCCLTQRMPPQSSRNRRNLRLPCSGGPSAHKTTYDACILVCGVSWCISHEDRSRGFGQCMSGTKCEGRNRKILGALNPRHPASVPWGTRPHIARPSKTTGRHAGRSSCLVPCTTLSMARPAPASTSPRSPTPSRLPQAAQIPAPASTP